MKTINCCVVGSSGNMSQAMIAALEEDNGFDPVLRLEIHRLDKEPHQSVFRKFGLQKVELVFDFTAPILTLSTARFCAKHRIPLVAGATGFSLEQMASLKRYAKKTPILWSANMCLTAHLLSAFLPLLGKVMPKADITIAEQHNRQKEDIPSGTAIFLANRIEQILGKRVVCNSIRGGTSAGGKNEMIFLNGKEELVISHRALSNDVYAQGALLAAKWLIRQKKPGFCTMQKLVPKF